MEIIIFGMIMTWCFDAHQFWWYRTNQPIFGGTNPFSGNLIIVIGVYRTENKFSENENQLAEMCENDDDHIWDRKWYLIVYTYYKYTANQKMF